MLAVKEVVYLSTGNFSVKIDDNHLYHGAALTQIAEHKTFTAINPLEAKGERCGCAFRINSSIGVYIKHDAAGPKGKYKEFTFNFSAEQIEDIEDIASKLQIIFIVLVCFKAKHICVIPWAELQSLIKEYEGLAGEQKQQYNVLVTAPENSQFRVYLNRPKTKGVAIRKKLIPRNAFPNRIFE